jgi:hypothetical protein
MGKPKSSAVAIISLTIGSGSDIGSQVQDILWSSYVNRGYRVKAVVRDPYFNLLKAITQNGDESKIKYLKEGRKKIVPIKFKYKMGEGETDEHVAYLTDMHSTGEGADGRIIFIGIDPLSFLLNRGNASGKSYEGSVSEVIKKVVEEYGNQPRGPGVTVAVSKTIDNKKNRWFMHRQDPKTFIRSLLDWSSSVTNKKSRWIVSSGWDPDNSRPKINIKEEADLEPLDIGIYVVSNNSEDPRDVRTWYLNMNNFTASFQASMATGGISAISGRYIDKIAIDDKADVSDKTTGNKVNVSVGSDRAFTKPGDVDWGTFIMSVPESNGGAVGVKYEDYIDGRARQKFMNLLGVSMNLMIETIGDPILQNSERLGVTTCTLQWSDLDREFYFMHGKWIVNGFEHHYDQVENWRTKIYMYRIDHDANAKKI